LWQSILGDPSKNVVEAFHYHKILQGIIAGEEPLEWSDSSDSDSDEDEDDDDDEEEEEDDNDDNDNESQGLTDEGDVGRDEGEKSDDEMEGNEDEGESPALKIPIYLLQPGTELTLPGLLRGCSNAQLRPDMWMSPPRLKMNPKMGFLSQLGNACIQAKVRDCRNPACLQKYKRMDETVPLCGWAPFRRWMLVAMSCQAAMTQAQKLSVAHTHIVHAVAACYTILKTFLWGRAKRPLEDVLDGPASEKINVAEVCNIIYYMVNIQAAGGTWYTDIGRWKQRQLLTVTLPPISSALRTIQSLGICQTRLWSLVNLSHRKEGDLPDIVAALKPAARLFRHKDHDACTPNKCNYTYMNTTKVLQLHTCAPHESSGNICQQEKKFPVDILETALELGRGTAWSCKERRLCKADEPYIAISHVWADGTGIGLKNPGTVNRCLFDYFARIAERLDCKGTWWDTLSIPTDPKARSKALNRMNASYKNAKYTVVHDKYLLDFEWKDDGSPCLAIVLSGWFTRGWTALELAMSEKVKVLYKGPDRNTPLMKDLDEDILAKDPASASRAYWLASSLIRRLRQKVGNVPDLLAVLKPRFTTKSKDRVEIAGLLAGIRDLNYNAFEGDLIQDILRSFGAIPHSCLLHGTPTLRDSGKFSWCPTSLDDMPIDLSSHMMSNANKTLNKDDLLEIDPAGAVKGWWSFRRVCEHDIKHRRLSPIGSDLVTEVKIGVALHDWKSCLLLVEDDDDDVDDSMDVNVALLVTLVGADLDDACLECRYVGAVRVTANAPDESCEDEIWDLEVIRIGNDAEKSPMDLREALKILDYDVDDEDDDDDDDGGNGDRSVQKSLIESSIQQKSKVSTKGEPWWANIADITEYIRPQTMPEIEGQLDMVKLSQLSQKDANHLLFALRSKNQAAVRHLIKSNVDLTPEMRHDLEGVLGRDKLPKLAKMLGDVYREHGRPRDAEEMYRMAVGAEWGLEGTKFFEAKLDLGSLCLELGKNEDAKQLFQEVLAYSKDQRTKQKQAAKAAKKRAQEKAQEKAQAKLQDKTHDQAKFPTGPDQKPFSRSNTMAFTRSNTFGLSRSDTATLSRSNTFADGIKGNEHEANDKTQEHRMNKIERLEDNAIAGLTLLYAEQGNLAKAVETYIFALEDFSEKALDQVEAFTYEWAPGLYEDFKFKKARTKEREDVYKLAIKRFSTDLGEDHSLTLITALNLGMNYKIQKKKAESEEMLKVALRGFRSTFEKKHLVKAGSEHFMTLRCLQELAGWSVEEGKFREAESMLRQVTSGFSAKFGLDQEHPFGLLATLDQGRCYLYSQNLEKAEEMFNKALTEFKQHEKFGDRHMFTAEAMRLLGTTSTNKGELNTAEKHIKKAISLLQRSYKLPHSYLCAAWESCALVQEKQGRLGDSMSSIRKSLEGYKASAGPKSSRTLEASFVLGRLYRKQGNLDDAFEWFQKVVDGLDDLLGAYNRQTLHACAELGSLCRQQRKFDLAEQKYQRVQRGYERSLDADDPLIFEAAYQLGLVYKDQWKWSSAEKSLLKALQGLEKIPNHNLRTEAVVELGDVYSGWHKFDKAEEMYDRAAREYSSTIGKDDPIALEITLKLVDVRIESLKQASTGPANAAEQGKIDEIQRMIEDVQQTYNRILTPDDPRVQHPFLCLGRLRYKQGEIDQAKDLLEPALENLRAHGAEDELATIDMKATLGYIMQDQNELNDAELLIEDARQGYEKLNHPSTIVALKALIDLYQGLDKTDELQNVKEDLQKHYQRLHGPEAAEELMSRINKSRFSFRGPQSAVRLSRRRTHIDSNNEQWSDSDCDDSEVDEEEGEDEDEEEYEATWRGNNKNAYQTGRGYAVADYWDDSGFHTVEEREEHVLRGMRGLPADSLDKIIKVLTDRMICRMCKARFDSRNLLFQHLVESGHETTGEIGSPTVREAEPIPAPELPEPSANPLSCGLCSQEFTSRRQLSRHVRATGHVTETGMGHETAVEIESTAVPEWEPIPMHVEVPEPAANSLSCRQCGEGFTSKSQLFKHLRATGHGMETEPVRHQTAGGIESTTVRHIEPTPTYEQVPYPTAKTLGCRQCGQEFPSKSQLFKHLRATDHGVETELVPEPGMRKETRAQVEHYSPFSYAPSVSNGATSLSCKECGQEFPSKTQLFKHLRASDHGTKTGSEHETAVPTEPETENVTELRGHQYAPSLPALNDATKSLTCKQCARVFFSRNQLFEHLNTTGHHLEAAAVIEPASTTTYSSTYVMTGDETDCDQCGRPFNSPSKLRKHLKSTGHVMGPGAAEATTTSPSWDAGLPYRR
jgi:tetratricopeptide (TPR) repeat protein